jgi:hypothetical protein
MSYLTSYSIFLDPPQSLSESSPFQPALPMTVKVPVNDLGKVDIYIDDTIGITPDFDDNTTRVNRAITLAIHSLAHPLDSSDKFQGKIQFP